MKIIFGEDKSETAKHAAKTVKGLEEYEQRNPNRIKPKGIAEHLARFPVDCEDCGETFWAKDEFANHLKCDKGATKKGIGFNFD